MRSSSTDHDSIPIKFLKFVADDIFPAQWKIGRIYPIPKVRNLVQMKDYRQ